MPAGGMTLVAEWQANSYKVLFDNNGGTGTMNAQIFEYDTPQNLNSNSFVRAGYSFQGWSEQKTGGYTYLDGASVNNLTAENDGTVILYAIWKAETMVLQFDVNGGNIGTKPDDIIAETDSTIDLNGIADPTRTGYTFKHWYRQGDPTKENVGASFKMPAADSVLVAEWEANTYTVNYHKNGGSGTMSSQEFNYDETKKLLRNDFTRDGYVFVGWATTIDGAPSYIDEALVSNLTADKAGIVDLYARWSANEQVLQFDVNGGDVSSKPANIDGETDGVVDLSGVANPTRTGYTFKHWYKQGDVDKTNVGSSITMPANGVILVAEWQANTYKVTFNANGGTEIMGEQDFMYDEAQELSANKFERAGYTFAGWATTAAGTASYADKASVTNLTAAADDVVELFAVWIANEQLIQFDVNGGAASSKPEDIIARTDSDVDMDTVTAPTRKGYTFKHWYTQGDADKQPVTGTIQMPAGGLVLVADWTANKYSVIFDANEGSGTMPEQVFVYDSAQKLSANTFERTNYDFVGWSTTKTGKAEFTNEAEVINLIDEKDGAVTLYAVWKLHERVLSFDVNGGDEATRPADIQKGIGEEVDLGKVTTPTRTGYTFDHWYEKGDADKAPVTGTIQMPEKNTVLVAAWKANQYTVTFDANGGEGKMNDQAFVYDAPQNLTENSFKRINYDFIGWATEEEGAVAHYDKEAVENLTEKDKETITLYAIWEKKPVLPILKANNIVLTTDQVAEFMQADNLAEKIAELSDAKVVDGNTNDLIASHDKITVDTSNVKKAKGVYKAKVSYETKTRSAVEATEIDVTVIEPSKKMQKITFDVNGGDAKSKPDDISAPVGTTVDLKNVKDPTRSGYTFVGWFNGEKKVGKTIEMPENGLQLLARWTKNGSVGSSQGSANTGSGNKDGLVLNTDREAPSTSDAGKTLPKTNDTTSIGLSISGMMLGLLAFFGYKKKKEKDAEKNI